MKELGKILFSAGILLALLGAWIWKNNGPGILSRLGRLPGDIHIQKEGFELHVPLATCLLISLLLTLVQWLLRR
ncbi:MAG: hypothetical protein RLZZ253_2838 [Verrucomicrobiota bacterium]|jgi:hypothetical protein